MATPFQLNPNRAAGFPGSEQPRTNSNGGNTLPFAGRSQQPNTDQRKPQEPTTVWANIVLCIPCVVSEENPDGFTRTSLPYGLAIDTMNTLPTKGSAEYLRDVIHPRNAFLGLLSQLGKALEPGEARLVTPVHFDEENPSPVLALEIRRVKDAEAREPESSDLASMISKLSIAI